MRKIKMNIKYVILGVASGLCGFSLGQLHKLKKDLYALEQMHEIIHQSYNITSVNIAKLQIMEDEINILQHIENKAVADSLKTSIANKQDSIVIATIKLTNKNTQRIQQIAKQHNIKIH